MVDLARMPHLLIAGTTGSGKSVAINAMILSLLYRLPPDQCKLIMIDPKVIELSVYEDIPHLLSPVVTEPHKAVVALKWVVREMDERYRLMSHLGVRDVFAFNRRLGEAIERGEQLSRRVQTGFEPGTGVPVFEEQPIEMARLPLIVVVVDEVADLMLTAGKEIESAIQRLSQKARAAGHPSDRRHPAALGRRADRRDQGQSAEPDQLPGQLQDRQPHDPRRARRRAAARPGRHAVHDAGRADHPHPRAAGHRRGGRERGRLTCARRASPTTSIRSPTRRARVRGGAARLPIGEPGNGEDAQYAQALQIVAQEGKASTSYLQRKMRIGYNSAARLIERMEADGHVSRPDHVGRRQVLIGGGAQDEGGRDRAW